MHVSEFRRIEMWKNDATCKSDNRKALKYVMALAWLTFQEAGSEEEEKGREGETGR